MPKEKSAGAIIFRKEGGPRGYPRCPKIYYLLLHYHSGHWEFPKGHIKEGENNEETVKREIREETGIHDVRIIPGFKKYIKYFFRQNYGLEGEAKKKAPWVFKLVVFHIAETKTKEVKISSEHTGFLWLPFEEAFKKTTFKNSKMLLKEANDFIVSEKSI